MITPKYPILFRTLEDGIVTLDRDGTHAYIADCQPCGDSRTDSLRPVRTWANTHAGECRAIPQRIEEAANADRISARISEVAGE